VKILDVDLIAFENGDSATRSAVVDGVMRSLGTGFVYMEHDISEGFLDEVYGRLEQFFTLPHEAKAAYNVPGSHGQTGYTGLLVETAATSDHADWKEMLNWGAPLPEGHPLRAKYPHRYGDPVLPEADINGIRDMLLQFHDVVADLQRRVLRIIATGVGVHEEFFDRMLVDGATLTRAIHYPAMDSAPGKQHVWAGEHGDINLITALPRATAPGLQVKSDEGWVDAAPPAGRAIINTGMLLDHLTNGLVPTGIHRVVASEGHSGDRYSVVQFAHPTPWTVMAPLASCVTADNPLRYPTISAADALDKVLWEINLNG